MQIQFVRYLLAGGANTAIGYFIYASLNYLLQDLFPYSYLAAAVLGNVLAISFSYLTYKFFVFKTRGNYLQEYFRCYAVYGLSIGLGLLLLPLFVEIFGLNSYLAGALLLPVTVLVSFFGHRDFSFRQKPNAPAVPDSTAGS